MKKRFIIMALVLVAIVGLFSYYSYVFKPAKMAEYLAANRPPPTPVEVARATMGVVPSVLSGIGTIQAVRQVTIAPEVPGQVVKILFTAGSLVKAGMPLVQLNDMPEQADLGNFRAQAKVAELTLTRSRQLLAKQFAPQAAVDQNQALYDQAKAGIAKSEALIAQKLIRAPFSGQLGIRQIQLGQYLQAGGPIVTLTDLDSLYVNFTLPEQARAKIEVGQAVRVAVDAYPGRTFEARLTTIDPQVSSDSRNMQVQASLDNRDHLLLPGMFANAGLVLASEPPVVTVPETAVDYSLYGDTVFVVRADGKDAEGKPVMKAIKTRVETGERFQGRIAVRSGLKAGDLVAVSGQINLAPDAVVGVLSEQALKAPAQMPTN